jgi:hypothetical protein
MLTTQRPAGRLHEEDRGGAADHAFNLLVGAAGAEESTA